MSEVEPGLLRRIEAIAETADEPDDGGEVAGAVAALRGEIGALRESVEQRMSALEDTFATSVREALGELAAAVDRSLGGLGGSVAVGLREAREADRSRVERVEATVAASRTHLEQEIASLRVDLADALDEVRDRVSADIAEQLGGFAGLDGAVERLNAETTTALDEVRASLDDVVGSVRGAIGALTEGTDRLASAGRGLLGYLADRERALEAERDRVLHDLLDEFADGLSAKERRWLSGRLADALERRRELRDAERWRKADGTRPLPEAPEPPDLAVYDAAAEQAAGGGPAKPATPAKKAKAPAKEASATRAPAKKVPPAKTPARKAAAGGAARPAGGPAAGPAGSGARRRRASVDAVPDVPSPGVAVDAAASPREG